MERALLREATVAADLQHKIVAAATRPDPLQSIVNTLATHLDTTVVLRDPQHGQDRRAGTTTHVLDPAVEAVIAELLESQPSRRSVTVHEPGRHVMAQVLHVAGRPMVFVVTSPTQLPAGTTGIVNVAASVIALVSGHVSTARVRALGEAVARAAIGESAEALEEPVVDSFEQALDRRWRVLVCSPPQARDDDLHRWRDHLASQLPTALRIDEELATLAVVPECTDPARIAHQLTTDGAAVGLSDPCAWGGIPAAARQARRRLIADSVAHRSGRWQ